MQCLTNWEGFEALRRNPRNVRRMIGGEHGTTIEFLVGAAALLRVDVREFFPETVEWVAHATLQLVAWNRSAVQNGATSNSRERTERMNKYPTYTDAHTYAEFLLKHPPCSKTAAEMKTIQNRLQSLEPDLSESIRMITASISNVLAERDAVVKQREEAR
ncbi:MAG: hypothetical protein U0798_04455 [Gemmataceae bacterium]